MSINPTPANQPTGLATIQTSPGTLGQTGAIPAMLAPAQQGFDIWGPIQRRKYLITLFCLIGAGLGYLYYSKAERMYSSNTELMISTQAPPSMVDGNIQINQDSLSKHSSLLASQLVLGSAVEAGKLESLKTFSDNPNAAGSLQGMIDVDELTDETLIISCTGPFPEELPVILASVVAAYEKVILEDSQNIGEQTIALVEKLAAQLTDEKEGAENKWLKLRQDLGITSLDELGNVSNPYNKRLFYLEDQQSKLKSDLLDVQERAQQLANSLREDPATKLIDPVMVKVAALVAQDYLNLSSSDYNGSTKNKQFSSELAKKTTLENRSWQLETKVMDLKFNKARLSETFGKGNKEIASLDKEIAYYTSQKKSVDEDVQALEKFLEEQTGESGNDTDPVQTEESFRDKERREWITMYQESLEQEQERLIARLSGVQAERDTVEKNASKVSMGIVELNMLQRQIDKKDTEVNLLLERLSEMNIMANNYTQTKVRTLDEPKYGKQVAPNLVRSIALGIMVAFMLGLGLAILVDQSELSFRSPHEIFERLNVPVVGRIPKIETRNIEAEHGHPSLITAHKPSSTGAEAFRDVRTGLFFRSNADDIRMILFTSPSPGDGKSTTIANMAISIAQSGKRVVLVDADFRRPRIHRYFEEENSPGMLDILSGEKTLSEGLRPTALQDNLFLLTTGGRPANPGELVTSEAFRDMLATLKSQFDYVLVDSPPVLPVSDPATIASIVDGVYMVTRIRKGVKLTAQKAKDTLESVNANWMGIIVNGIDENPHYSEYGYQYGNYSYYGGMYGRYYDSRSQAYRDQMKPKVAVKS